MVIYTFVVKMNQHVFAIDISHFPVFKNVCYLYKAN